METTELEINSNEAKISTVLEELLINLLAERIDANKQLRDELAKMTERAERAEYCLAQAEKQCETLTSAEKERDEAIAKLQQPGDAKPVKYAWRDATPEDAGKGYRSRVRDEDTDNWTDSREPLKAYDGLEPYCWLCVFYWRYCQVYAPAAPPETTGDVLFSGTYRDFLYGVWKPSPDDKVMIIKVNIDRGGR